MWQKQYHNTECDVIRFRWLHYSRSTPYLISWLRHYDDVIMTMLASQITSLTVVYSIVYSGVNQRKHQSSASLAFVWEIHRGPVNFPHKWPVTRKMFPFDDVIMVKCLMIGYTRNCIQCLNLNMLPNKLINISHGKYVLMYLAKSHCVKNLFWIQFVIKVTSIIQLKVRIPMRNISPITYFFLVSKSSHVFLCKHGLSRMCVGLGARAWLHKA